MIDESAFIDVNRMYLNYKEYWLILVNTALYRLTLVYPIFYLSENQYLTNTSRSLAIHNCLI